jgi:hypothetical protein
MLLRHSKLLFQPIYSDILTRFTSSLAGKMSFFSTKMAPSHNLALRFRPGRTLGKKRQIPAKDAWSVVGYSTADRYNLMALASNLSHQVKKNQSIAKKGFDLQSIFF